MSTFSEDKYKGGLTFNAPLFSLGGFSGALNSGLSFDLPLATIAAFNNQALNFTTTGASNRFGFLKNVIGSTESGVQNSLNYNSQLYNNVISHMHINSNTSLSIIEGNKQKSKGGGFCFITTAVCKEFGLSDDCEKLQILRAFRDDYMLPNPQRKLMVDKYYKIAPDIVDKLNAMPEAAEIYSIMDKQYIDVCLNCIEHGHFEAALWIYASLVNYAENVVKK